MDFNATIDLIIRELDEAREIIDDLKRYPGAPVIQIELAKSKCRNASEVISLLKQIQDSAHTHVESHNEAAREEPEKKPDKPVAEQEKKALQKEAPQQKAKKPDPVEPAVDENTVAEQKPKKPYVAPIIADTFSHLANRFNEQIGENQGDEFSYMHGKHAERLSELIGLNDRFYYISEIFNGKRDAYSEALTRLENANNLKEAKDILAEYKNERTSAEAVKQLLDLTRRNFGIHE